MASERSGSGLGSAYFVKFKIHNLDAQWMNKVWDDGDLNEISQLPEDFLVVHRTTNWVSLLTGAADIVRRVTRDGDEIGGMFWTELADAGISLKGVTIVAASLTISGDDYGKTMSHLKYSDREVGVFAASFYLCLVSVPGSNAFRLFNAMIYERVVLMFASVKRLLRDICEEGGGGRSSPTRKKSKRGVGQASSQRDNQQGPMKRKGNSLKSKASQQHRDNSAMFLDDSIESSNDNDNDNEAEEETSIVLSSQDVQSLINILVTLATDLNLFLNNYPLKTRENSLEFTVQHIGELLLVETRFPSWNLSHLTSESLMVMKSICNPIHGNVSTLLWIVLKNLFQAILSEASKKVAIFVVQLAKEIPGGEALPSVRRFLQNIGFKASDRADIRNKQCALAFFILDQLPMEAYADVIRWFISYALSAKIAHRLFVLELFSLLLGHPPKEVDAVDILPVSKMEFLSHECLLTTVLSRCSDKAPAVRAKALCVLSSSTMSTEPKLHQLVLKMFVPTRFFDDNANTTSIPSNEDVESNVLHSHLVEVGVTNSEKTLELLRHRLNDSKVHVRRAAIQVLQSVVELHVDCVTDINIESIQMHCRDCSLLVRKQAMQSISDLLQHYPNANSLQHAWLEEILPMIVDPEETVQTKCVDSVNDVILQNIVPFAKSKESYHHMAWNIMNQIANSGDKDSRHYLRKAVDILSGHGKLRRNLSEALMSHIGTNNNAVAWMMLATIAPCVTITRTDIIISYWEDQKLSAANDVLQHVLVVIGEVCHTFDNTQREALMSQFADLLSEFKYQPVIISEMIITMRLLGQSNDEHVVDQNFKMMFSDFCSTIIKLCDKYLSSVFLNKNIAAVEIDEERAVIYLFTVGELSLHCPSNVPKRIFLLLKSFLAAPTISNTQIAESEEIPNSQSSQEVNFNRCYGSMVNKRIRNMAFLSLGKLCLQHEQLAKQCVPALGKELEHSDDPITRNNVVIIMADLCKRYTTLVDEYIPNVTACLRDTSQVVRRQTLLLLTNLLQEDYLKWKGPLFFHYLSTLVDESSDVRSLAEYSLRHIFYKRHPGMFHQHFVECIFHFNAYKSHEKYNKVLLSEKDYQLFSMAGHNLRDKRMKLYTFMLENMSDEHRFLVMTKICQDILGSALDGSIMLTVTENGQPCPVGVALLKDSFAILCCDEIKLANLRGGANNQATPGEDYIEPAELEAVALATAKKTVITQVVKKNAVENIVPVVVSLKHKLEKSRSPLMKDLLRYVKELMRDYKNEIKDILAGDKLLAAEIEYDLKQFDQGNRFDVETRRKEMSKQAPKQQRRLLTTQITSTTASIAPANQSEPELQEITQKKDTTFVEKSEGEKDSNLLPVVRLHRMHLCETLISQGNAFCRAISTPRNVAVEVTFNEFRDNVEPLSPLYELNYDVCE